MNWLAFTVITTELLTKLLVEGLYYSTSYNVAYQFQEIVHNFLDRVQIVI